METAEALKKEVRARIREEGATQASAQEEVVREKQRKREEEARGAEEKARHDAFLRHLRSLGRREGRNRLLAIFDRYRDEISKAFHEEDDTGEAAPPECKPANIQEAVDRLDRIQELREEKRAELSDVQERKVRLEIEGMAADVEELRKVALTIEEELIQIPKLEEEASGEVARRKLANERLRFRELGYEAQRAKGSLEVLQCAVGWILNLTQESVSLLEEAVGEAGEINARGRDRFKYAADLVDLSKVRAAAATIEGVFRALEESTKKGTDVSRGGPLSGA